MFYKYFQILIQESGVIGVNGHHVQQLVLEEQEIDIDFVIHHLQDMELNSVR